MSRPCTLCTAPAEARQRIDNHLTNQTDWSNADVARYAALIGFTTSRDAVRRHREHYLWADSKPTNVPLAADQRAWGSDGDEDFETQAEAEADFEAWREAQGMEGPQ